MPLIKYREYKPKADTLLIIRQAQAILEEYVAQGFDLTLRQLYYQFVGRNVFPASWIDPVYNARHNLALNTKNTEKNYKKLGTIIAKAREGGFIDWDHIKDRGRRVSKYPHADSDVSFAETALRGRFFLDMWQDQPKRIEIWCEKDALSQVIERAADPYDVPTFATKGYMSASAAWEAGHKRFLKYAQQDQEIVIIHLADHDPSGINMTEDVWNRISEYSRPTQDQPTPTRLTVERLAMTMEQIEEHNPPPDPAKQTDPRFQSYQARFGDESWELDALDPPLITAMIDERIREHLDHDLYNARREEEAEMQQRLTLVAENYEQAVGFLEENDE